MSRFDKSTIRKGMHMTLACNIPAQVHYSDNQFDEPPPPPRALPRPVRYGDPIDKPPATDFKAISARLDLAKSRLETIVKDFKNACL